MDQFAVFVLGELERRGVAFSEFDYSLFRQGAYSWKTLLGRNIIDEVLRDSLIFESADQLEFHGGSPLVSARFRDSGGDHFFLCLDEPLEALLTSYYRAISWNWPPTESPLV